MIEHALDFLNKGFSIIPITPRGKRPLISWLQLQKRYPTQEEVEKWFKDSPNANIGIVTGQISGIVVVDFDTAEAYAEAQLKGLPTTPTVKTSRGYHCYFKWRVKVSNFQKRDDLPGIDLRGDGGYVVAPGSIHESGHTYQLVEGLGLDDLSFAELPDWIIATVPTQKTPLKQLYKGVSNGSRNDSLARLTGSWVKDGLTFEECIENAKIFNQKSNPPLTDKELQTVVGSIYRIHSEDRKDDTKLIHIKIAEEILNTFTLIYCANNFYSYEKGCYKKVDKAELSQWVGGFLGDNHTSRRLEETISYLKTKTYLKAEALNNSDLLNLKNGLLDLKSFKLIPHSKDIYSTIQLPVNYSPESRCPKWIKIIEEIFENNEQKIGVVQEFFGLCFTRLVKYGKALFLIGDGANGKSVLLYVLQQILGQGNYSAIPLEKFNCGHYMVNLFGKLANISIETFAKSSVYDSTFKAVVTGDEITADAKFEPPIKFSPFCKLIFALNNMPRVDDKTSGFFRRLIILRFNRIFKGVNDNKNLKHELFLEEADGIFLWCLEGLRRLEIRGDFETTEEMEHEVAEYRKENNNVLVFVDEKCLLGAEQTFPKDELYQKYSEWCKGNGYVPLAKGKFGKELKAQLRLGDERNSEFRYWRGIKFNKWE